MISKTFSKAEKWHILATFLLIAMIFSLRNFFGMGIVQGSDTIPLIEWWVFFASLAVYEMRFSRIFSKAQSLKLNFWHILTVLILIASLRYYLEISMVQGSNLIQYLYHTIYYLFEFFALILMIIYIFTREIPFKAVALVIFPFKLISVIFDRIICSNMQRYDFLPNSWSILDSLKYIFFQMGSFSKLTWGLSLEWLVIFVSVGVYVYTKSKKMRLLKALGAAVLSNLIIALSGSMMTHLISPAGQYLPKRLNEVMISLIEVPTLLTDKLYYFYGGLYLIFLSLALILIFYLYDRKKFAQIAKGINFKIFVPLIVLIGLAFFTFYGLYLFDFLFVMFPALFLLVLFSADKYKKKLAKSEFIIIGFCLVSISLLFSAFISNMAIFLMTLVLALLVVIKEEITWSKYY